ncbi:hypothetical protein ACFTXM_17880 [Streptomyces sp. NPDC056930]|uniref:hypothetical protein n=1 Tax=Streptomyces sp. NPDC056930 TaxID=3345967 RepID=UPI00362EAC3A
MSTSTIVETRVRISNLTIDIRYVPGSVEAVTPFVHEVVAAAEAKARPATWRDLAGVRAARSARSALNEVFPGTRIESAQSRWRAVNAPHMVALLRAGACLERGHPVERPEEAAV